MSPMGSPKNKILIIDTVSQLKIMNIDVAFE